MLCARVFVQAALAVAVLLPWGGSGEAATLELSGKQAVLQAQGHTRPLPAENFRVDEAEHAPFLYVVVMKEAAARYGLQAGVHLFQKNGAAAGIIAMREPAVCGDIYLSPDKTHIFVDSGTWVVRDLLVYSYPAIEAEPVAIITYVRGEAPAPQWLDGEHLLYTTISKDSARVCDYDLCGPQSAQIFNVRSGREAVLKRGDKLCDYMALRVHQGRAVLGARCLRRAEDWRTAPSSTPLREMTVEVHEARTAVESRR